jgi:hypothetical protein
MRQRDPYAPPIFAQDGLLAGGNPNVVQPGQSEQLGLDPKTGSVTRKSQLLRCQGEDAVAVNTTVVLAIAPDGNVTPGAENETPPCFARITFGVGGTSADVEVDYINGAMVSVPASRLDLTAHLDMTEAEIQQNPPRAARVGAFVCYIPMTRGAQRTKRTGALDLNASVIIEIPKFAKSLTLLSTLTAAAALLEFSTDALAANIIAQVGVVTNNLPTQVVPVLPNEARYVKLTNLALAGVSFRAVFGLYL